jgi:hypothetical protein
VVTILKNLWLDDWSETILLADGSISSERVSSLGDGDLRWAAVLLNFEDGSPLGKSASQLVVLGASGTKAVKTLGGSLIISSSDDLESSVDLDTAVNASGSEDVAELFVSSGIRIFDGLVEHDHSTDVLLDVWGREQKLSVGLSIGVGVLNANAVKSLSDGAGRLIGSEDTLSWGADLLASLDQLGFVIS